MKDPATTIVGYGYLHNPSSLSSMSCCLTIVNTSLCILQSIYFTMPNLDGEGTSSCLLRTSHFVNQTQFS